MHTISFPFVLRRLILIALVVFPQRFWFRRGWQLTRRIRRPAWNLAGRISLVIAACAIVLVLADRIMFLFIPQGITRWLTPIVQLWVFTSTFAFFCVRAVHAVEWLWLKVNRLRCRPLSDPSHRESACGCRTLPEGRVRTEDAPDPSRRSFFRYAAVLVGTAPFFPAIYGFTRERLNFQIVRVDVPVANLPPALDGLRIVQLSDIHIGDFMPPDEIRRAVDMANALAPHLAVITGDLVTDRDDPLADCVFELSRLKAPLGVWGCNGNHEIYAAAENAAEALFRSHGMTLLRSASAQLDWNGQKINLIGVDYQRDVDLTGLMMPKLSSIESLVRRDMINILLSHNPNTLYRAADLGIELSLAGHTHGGQINVEIVNHNFSPARFMTKFIAGLYRLPMTDGSARAHLYVNRGLGTLGIPARLGAAPEITLLTLRSA